MSYDVKERESEEERNCGKWTTRVANKGGCPINRGITLVQWLARKSGSKSPGYLANINVLYLCLVTFVWSPVGFISAVEFWV